MAARRVGGSTVSPGCGQVPRMRPDGGCPRAQHASNEPPCGRQRRCRPDAASCRRNAAPPVLGETLAACPRLFAMVPENGGKAWSGGGALGAFGRRQRPRRVRSPAWVPSRLQGHPQTGCASCALVRSIPV